VRIFPILSITLMAFSATAQTPAKHAPENAAEMDRLSTFLKGNMHERGQAKLDRIDLDAVQRLCNQYADNPPAEQAKRLEQAQLEHIVFPSGNLLGDWKAGEKIAQDGRGMTWSDKPGTAGGSCYNCHQISPKEMSFGTVGPSLYQFGKHRGNGPDIQKYVYSKIYNSKAYNLCTEMPRFGHIGALEESQIKDLVALLLDPESPVNK
jgi:L-cysteine S-thiosulfotransferase